MVWVRERLGAERVSERRACQVLGQGRSTQRRERHIPDDEARLVAEMVELATHYGRYGYRRITAMLRWEGWKVNHKRVERLWRQEGLKVPSRQPKRRRLWLHDGSCVRLRAAHKDHVWSYDFVHERTHDGRAFRLLTLLDEYTRECLAIEVQRQMNHQDVLDRLAELFVDRGVPEYIRSDNGSEFTAQAVRDWLKGGELLPVPTPEERRAQAVAEQVKKDARTVTISADDSIRQYETSPLRADKQYEGKVLGLLLPDPAIAQGFPLSGYMVSPAGVRCHYTEVLNKFLIEALYEGAQIGANGRIEFDDQDCMNTTTSADNLGTVLVTVSNHIWSWYAAQVGEGDPEDAIYAGLSGTSDNLCLQSASNHLGVSLNFIKTGGGRGLLAVNHALALDGCPDTVDPDGVGRELAKELMRWIP